MKKLLFLLIILPLVFSYTPNDAQAWVSPSEAWAGCSAGRPTVTIEFGAVAGADTYRIWRGATKVYEGKMTVFTDTSATGLNYYGTTYRYEIEAVFPPAVAWKRLDGGDVTTAFCTHASNPSGPTEFEATTASKTFSSTYVYGTNIGAYWGIDIYKNGEGLDVAGSGVGGDTLSSPGGTQTRSITSSVFNTPGIYEVCSYSNLVLYPPVPAGTVDNSGRSCTQVNVTASQSTRNLAIDGSTVSVTKNVGDTAVASWSSSGVSKCESYKDLNGNSNFPGWADGAIRDFSGTATILSASTNIGAFPSATIGAGYTVKLTCPPTSGFVANFEPSTLANNNWFAPFFGFVKTAYATVSGDTAYVQVYVNALPDAILNVFAYMYPDTIGGPSGYQVTINGTQTGTGGTTIPPGYNYTDTVPAGTAINTTLHAPNAPSGKKFMGWNGCNAGYVSPSQDCPVTVSLGGTKSVSANYGPDFAGPDLTVDSPISITPNPADYGTNATFRATVRNVGDASAGSSISRLFIDYDSNGGGVSWDFASDAITGSLAPLGTEVETWVWPATRSGTHTARVCADSQNTVAESNESNNCSNSSGDVTFTVGVDPNQPQPVATLNVDSSPRGVSIERVSGPTDIGGITYYSRSYLTNLSTQLRAPLTDSDGNTFSSWSGCNPVSGNLCTVSVNVGYEKTITANYNIEQPPPPPSSDCPVEAGKAKICVNTSGTLYKTIVYSSTGHGGETDYTYTSSTAINDASLVFDLISGNYELTSVTGCDSIAPHTLNQCRISVAVGSAKTVTANYAIPGDDEGGSWDYTLSNSDPISINKVDGVGQKVISRTLTPGSGTPDAVSTISLSGVPAGVTAAIANNPCTPSCSSTITFTVDASAPNGATPITVTSQPGAKTLTFNLIITGNAMNVTCVPDPAVAMIGQPVTWSAKATNGVPPYTYVWSGSGIPIDPAPTVNPYTVTYSTIGQKMISAEVTDSLGDKSSCPANSSVQINFNPSFEEF